jgi:sigma-E factor negative regulatory protein RseC
MIEQNATVVAVESNAAWVETQRHSACGACAMNKGCGAGMFAKAFGFKSPQLRVVDTQGIAVGDQVVIGIDERALVRGSFAAYMVPILFMLGFAMLGETFFAEWLAVQSDGLTLSLGIAGLIVGLLWLRRYSRRVGSDSRYQPVILHKGDTYLSSACEKSGSW